MMVKWYQNWRSLHTPNGKVPSSVLWMYKMCREPRLPCTFQVLTNIVLSNGEPFTLSVFTRSHLSSSLSSRCEECVVDFYSASRDCALTLFLRRNSVQFCWREEFASHSVLCGDPVTYLHTRTYKPTSV